jgi:hypothetical protein
MRQRIARSLRIISAVSLLVPLLYLGQAGALACLTPDCGATTDTSTLFGQTQAYDVLIRGDGEAAVNARITLSNNNTKPLSKLDYSVISGQLGDVTAYQQVLCSDLPVLEPANSAGSTTSSPTNTLSPATAPAGTVATTDVPECYAALTEHPLDSSSPNQPNAPGAQLPYYYPSSNYTYKKVSVSKTGNSFSLTLPQAVKNNKSTTIVMVYNVTSVAHKSLGVFHYTFKTLKSGLSVSDVTVAISVDENYQLADAANGNVNYHPVASSNAVSSSLQAGTAQAANGAASADVSNYVSSIGGNGSVTKHASSLAPQETFIVAGRFASSSFLLNWPRTVLRWVIAITIVAALIFWYLRQRRRLQRWASDDQTPQDADTTVYSESTPSISLRALPFYNLGTIIKRHLQERRIRPMFFAWLCGILSIGILAGVLLAYSALSEPTNTYNSTLGTGGNLLLPGLYIGLGALAFLGFLFFSIGLPILYTGSFRRAMHIFLHLIIFYIVVGIALVTLAVRLANNSPVNPNPDVCPNYGGAVSGLCSGINNGAAQSSSK